MKSPRERAARALCRKAGNPENTMFDGAPMWRSYLPEVDTVLEAALPAEEWARLRAEDSGIVGQPDLRDTVAPRR